MHGRRAPQLESCLLASHQKGFAGPRRPLLLPDGCVLAEPVAAHCPTEPAPGPGALGVWSRTVSVEAPLRMGRARVGTSPDCSLRRGHTRVAAAPHARAVSLAGPRPLTPLRAAWESSCPRCPPALGALVISRGPSGGREAYFSSDVWWGPLSRLGESPE